MTSCACFSIHFLPSSLKSNQEPWGTIDRLVGVHVGPMADRHNRSRRDEHKMALIERFPAILHELNGDSKYSNMLDKFLRNRCLLDKLIRNKKGEWKKKTTQQRRKMCQYWWSTDKNQSYKDVHKKLTWVVGSIAVHNTDALRVFVSAMLMRVCA